MHRGGRAKASALAAFLRLIQIHACITIAAGTDYGVPFEIKLWDTGRTPLAHMVDVTNEFGLKVLAEHNFLNDNNIAFSPYGLMGILVALYEGVDGESSYQIQRGIQLPRWNRNIIRVGFRDIHRTLKTYFVPEEGFLAGLALNNENVTFNDSYKEILRFYGFDLENDQLPTFPPQGNNTNETTTIVPTTNSDVPSGDRSTTVKPREETTPTSAKDETATNPSAETISDTLGSTATTTASPSSAPNAESTSVSSTITTTEKAVITSEAAAPETTPQLTTSVTTPALPPSSTEEQNISITSETALTTTSTSVAQNAETDGETTSQQTSLATVALTDEVTGNNEVNNATTADVASSTGQTTTVDTATVTSTVSSENTQTESAITASIAETQPTEQMPSTLAELITATDTSTTVVNDSTLETLQRRKKSIVDFIFTDPPYIADDTFYRSFDIPPEIPNVGFDDKVFLANGLKSVQATYMHYDTVLEHAYLPHLEASAVRLPLDSDRYYLLVVLPMRGGSAELGRLLARMARESDLSDVYAALRPRRVRGIVPSFTVKGHVTLTTDLQKLGIRDVFEPRQRDFTPMTRQAGVYVRSIEQAVSVAIRKYRPDDHKKNRYVTNREPVTFYATYPFLYFVMDASIHVSLMAGKMVDPLNSRIL